MTSPLDPEIVERIRKLGGDGLLSELVELFLHHAPERVEALRTGVLENDLQRVEKAAHSFRSSSVTLGARSAAEQAAALEVMAQRGDADELRRQLPAFEKMTTALLGSLSVEFGGGAE